MIRAYDDNGNVVDLVEHDRKIYNKAIDDMIAIIKEMRETAIAMMWTECECDCDRFIEQAEELKEGWKRMTKIKQIEELNKYIEELDSPVGYKDDVIFLLSIEEYEKYKYSIPRINVWWWLRSPGYNDRYATTVSDYGCIDRNGSHVYYTNYAVRPALKYTNLKSRITESCKGEDYFVFKETRWKIIDKENELAISELPIDFGKLDNNNNDYEKSYIRDWLLEWVVE